MTQKNTHTHCFLSSVGSKMTVLDFSTQQPPGLSGFWPAAEKGEVGQDQ